MSLSVAMQRAFRSNELATIEAEVAKLPSATRQEELNTCLTLAMPQGSIEMIELLVNLGARLDQHSLYAAIRREDPSLLQLLVDSGWDINSNNFERPAIHIAVRYETSLRWLLEHGADPDMTLRVPFAGSCQQPTTALACAAKLSDPAPLQFLFSHGAQMDPKAIFHAIGIRYQKNGTATLEALIDHGANVNNISKRWRTPLHQAIRRGQLAKVRLLLARGADPNIKTLTGRASALEYAKEEGRMEMYEMMKVAQDKDEL